MYLRSNSQKCLWVSFALLFCGITHAQSEKSEPTKTPVASRLKVGEKALGFCALSASGDALTSQNINRKVYLITFLSLKDEDFGERLQTIEHLREKHSKRSDFLIVNVFTDEWDSYIDYMRKRGSRFYNDPRMWNISQRWLSKKISRKDQLFGVDEIGNGMTPRSFMISADRIFLAVDIPQKKLKNTVDDIMKMTENKKRSPEK